MGDRSGDRTIGLRHRRVAMASTPTPHGQQSQLIVTSTGELREHRRSKPKQTSWRWGNKWTVPVSHDFQDLSAIAAYIRTHYGVSVPKFDAPS